jgi:hypothetical protein
MKSYVIVVLHITANENKLPPYVIPIKQKDSFSKDLIVYAKNKFMDDIRVNGRLARLCMGRLVWCVNRLRNKSTDLVIIPSGMTSQLNQSSCP